MRFPPNFPQGIVEGQRNNPIWYRYIQGLDNGEAPAQESVITVGASPFTYQAPRGGFVIVQGGTVSAVSINRSGTAYTVGQVQGQFPLAQNDQLKVTWSGKPRMTFFPT